MKFLIVGIIIGVFIIETIASLLNFKSRKNEIPPVTKDIYDFDQYQQWLAYFMSNFRFSMIKSIFETLLLIVALFSGAFAWLDTILSPLAFGDIWHSILYLSILLTIFSIIDLPFDYYQTFHIEAMFGFNKTTQKTFWFDQLKRWLISIALLSGIVWVLLSLYFAFQDRLWYFIIGAWMVLSIVLIVLFILNTKVFIKIFNRLTPLEEGTLKTKISELASRVGFKIDAISSMDASKRSSKLNAFFSGLGKTREVVLYDTLIEKMSEDQIVSVLAHELGHAKHHDVIFLLLRQIIMFGLYAILLGVILQNEIFTTSFGFSGFHFGFSIILFSILMSPFNLLIGFLLNYLSRKAEYKADAFACRMTDTQSMIEALKVIAKANYSNLTPHPFYVLMHYSHPTIADRLQAMEGINH